MFAIVRALLHGKSIETIHEKTQIDTFFLEKIANIVNTFKELRGEKDWKNPLLIRRAKKQGFSDLQLAKILSLEESSLRQFRKENGIIPKVNKIDTLA
jgi:carbamoyl-phosphate synthase large subunit